MSEVSYKTLGGALERLREALVLLEAHRGDALHVSMRNSALLSFQFTYALCRPMLERFLVNEGDDPLEIQEMSYAALGRSLSKSLMKFPPVRGSSLVPMAWRPRCAATPGNAISRSLMLLVRW